MLLRQLRKRTGAPLGSSISIASPLPVEKGAPVQAKVLHHAAQLAGWHLVAKQRVTLEMVKFQAWCENLGCAAFKRLKDKVASQVQLFIGFWWDSFEGTRSLEERKLFKYLDVLLLFSKRKSLTLHDLLLNQEIRQKGT